MTIKIVTILDPHLCAHSPASYKMDYWEVLQGSVNKVIDWAIKNEVDAFVWGGDIFHLKSSSRNPLSFIRQVMRIMKKIQEAGMANVGIAGNHDILYGSIEKGLEGQPLGILIEAGLYHLLDDNDYVIEKEGRRVRIAGASFHHGQAEPTRALKAHGDTLVAVGHFWFGSQSGDFFGEPIYGPDVLGSGEADVYVIGHHHEDQGIREIAGKIYVSHGSITRTGAHANDLRRRPSAGVLEFETGSGVEDKSGSIKFNVLRPKLPPIEELIDTERHEEKREEEQKMVQFMSTLKGVALEVQDPGQMIKEANARQEVKERAEGYLERAEEELE